MNATEWILLLTAAIVGWYTWETSRLRRTARDQLAQQIRQVDVQLQQIDATIRPFVIAHPSGAGHGRMIVENVGAGPALNLRLPDIVFNPDQEDWRIELRFPECVPVLRVGEREEIAVESFVNGREWGDFFSGHLDPKLATKSIRLLIQYDDIQLKPYAVEQIIEPNSLSVTSFRVLPAASQDS
jgi:hypothetical protein